MLFIAPYMVNIILLILVIASPYNARSEECPADDEEPWTYEGNNGPMNWGKTFEDCNGTKQSPIDINIFNVQDKEPPLKFENYDIPISKATIENDGHTIEVSPEDGINRTVSVNGTTYKLHQFHFHWGHNKSEGSEHTFNGKQFAMEMHLVHMNGEDFAVVGVPFLEVSFPIGNSELRKITDKLSDVKYKDNTTEITENVTLSKLIPANTGYFRYEGSLTTPNCTEGVKWSVAIKLAYVEKSQMEKFRELYSVTKAEAHPGCKLSGNFRPVQPLNGRKVSKSEKYTASGVDWKY